MVNTPIDTYKVSPFDHDEYIDLYDTQETENTVLPTNNPENLPPNNDDDNKFNPPDDTDATTVSATTTDQLGNTRISGLNRALHNITTFYNPDPIQHATLSFPCDNDECALTTFIPDMNIFPNYYSEAMTRKDKNEWWKAMVVEFDNATSKNVWQIIKKSKLPKGRNILGNRWVFARKDDDRYRARTVAKGFSQIPGKDFQENHAPVVCDTTGA